MSVIVSVSSNDDYEPERSSSDWAMTISRLAQHCGVKAIAGVVVWAAVNADCRELQFKNDRLK